MKKLLMKASLSTLGIAALLVVVLAVVGSSVGVSQEEDVCAAVFDLDVDWSAQAYHYCDAYCVQLDCAGTPAEENLDACLTMLDRYQDLMGGEVPSCEVQP